MKILRTFFHLLLFSFLLLANNIAFAQWEQVNIPDSISAGSICFNNNDIYLATNKGVYYSNDNCENWEFIGLESYPIWSIFITSDNTVLAGANENIFKYLGNNEWQLLFINGNVSNVICLYESDSGYLFDGTWEGIYRSTDFGETWIQVLDLVNSEVINDISCNSQGILFAGSTCYAGGNYPGGVYRSEDGGENWELIGLDYHFVSSLEINSHDTIFVGTRGHWSSGAGGVFKSLDETGNLWQNVYENNLITSMCINEFNTLIIGCSSHDGALV